MTAAVPAADGGCRLLRRWSSRISVASVNLRSGSSSSLRFRMKRKASRVGASFGRESFLRGSWDGIEKQPNRVKANRDHDKQRTVGKIINFWPSRIEGLVGAARIVQTPLGDETLALATRTAYAHRWGLLLQAVTRN